MKEVPSQAGWLPIPSSEAALLCKQKQEPLQKLLPVDNNLAVTAAANGLQALHTHDLGEACTPPL